MRSPQDYRFLLEHKLLYDGDRNAVSAGLSEQYARC